MDIAHGLEAVQCTAVGVLHGHYHIILCLFAEILRNIDSVRPVGVPCQGAVLDHVVASGHRALHSGKELVFGGLRGVHIKD